jgi:hypothetical protein
LACHLPEDLLDSTGGVTATAATGLCRYQTPPSGTEVRLDGLSRDI